jgi:hypothetical protein
VNSWSHTDASSLIGSVFPGLPKKKGDEAGQDHRRGRAGVLQFDDVQVIVVTADFP